MPGQTCLAARLLSEPCLIAGFSKLPISDFLCIEYGIHGMVARDARLFQSLVMVAKLAENGTPLEVELRKVSEFH